MGVVVFVVAIAVVALVVIALLKSIKTIGATEVGLVTKRFGFGKLSQDNPIAFRGEAGYQARLLMPGLRFKLWPIFGVKKFPWAQVPAGGSGGGVAGGGGWAGGGGSRSRSAPRARCTSRSSATSPTCPASSTATARRACSAPCSRRE